MRVLFKYKANPNIVDKVGFTPLDYALRRDPREAKDIVALLEAHGAKQGIMLDQDPAVYEAQKARAKQILNRARHNKREVCSFGLVGEDYNTGGTDTSWAVIQGTTGLVTAKCQDDGYLHYVLMSAKPGTPMLMKRNQPVSGGRASIRIEFADEWRNAHIVWFFSKTGVDDDLTMAVEQNKAWATASIPLMVAPVNGRKVGKRARAVTE
jgi:hypothetical protein